LQRLASTGVALLLVEQYINRALDMADEVVLLDRGEVAYHGSPADLDQDTVMQRYLGIETSVN
jgi:branched-chain amino acid transport system ATP-binding protein